MYVLLALAFIFGYIFIALEHPIKVDKAASAILTGVICWVLLVLGQDVLLAGNLEHESINESLLIHLGEIAQILFFLLGAMTIVELIDAYGGFEIITSKVTTTDRVKLLWIVCIMTFFFSAVLDNLTTAIVMAALLKKLTHHKEDLWFFAGMVVIAANAGGAWSPIGDVTTIMLWIDGQISGSYIITKVFFPSLVCLLVPLTLASIGRKGEVERPKASQSNKPAHQASKRFESLLMLVLGVLGLLFVPVFKSITNLPPFMGMLFSLGLIWVITELIHRKKTAVYTSQLSVGGVIRKIDTPTVLFFLGILLAVASLQTAGHLEDLAQSLDATFGNIYIINIIVGLLSAIIDNVPLVAGAMGMYPMSTYPQDHEFWGLLAYCAGTGGSALIIGSAAGVAIMGILKLDFIWYLKKISWLAIIGYFAGVAAFYFL